MHTKHAIIIGGGVGGLAAAVRLAAAGVRVTLLEKNDRVGGKLNLWQVDHPARTGERPFRFDTGPSLLTLPFVFEQLFAAAGERMADHLDLVRLDPIARFVWPDGATFELRNDPADTAAAVAAFSPEDAEGWHRFYAGGRDIWDRTAELFLYQSPEQMMAGDGTFDPRRGLAMLTVPFRIGMFARFNKRVDRRVKSPRLRELLYQYATYSGASPFKAPATLAVIPHAEQHFGGWYPRGGMYLIAEALVALAAKLGVDVRTRCPVSKVIVENATARGVVLDDGTELRADAVIANSDVVHTYRRMLDSGRPEAVPRPQAGRAGARRQRRRAAAGRRPHLPAAGPPHEVHAGRLHVGPAGHVRHAHDAGRPVHLRRGHDPDRPDAGSRTGARICSCWPALRPLTAKRIGRRPARGTGTNSSTRWNTGGA